MNVDEFKDIVNDCTPRILDIFSPEEKPEVVVVVAKSEFTESELDKIYECGVSFYDFESVGDGEVRYIGERWRDIENCTLNSLDFADNTHESEVQREYKKKDIENSPIPHKCPECGSKLEESSGYLGKAILYCPECKEIRWGMTVKMLLDELYRRSR